MPDFATVDRYYLQVACGQDIRGRSPFGALNMLVFGVYFFGSLKPIPFDKAPTSSYAGPVHYRAVTE